VDLGTGDSTNFSENRTGVLSTCDIFGQVLPHRKLLHPKGCKWRSTGRFHSFVWICGACAVSINSDSAILFQMYILCCQRCPLFFEASFEPLLGFFGARVIECSMCVCSFIHNLYSSVASFSLFSVFQNFALNQRSI